MAKHARRETMEDQAGTAAGLQEAEGSGNITKQPKPREQDKCKLRTAKGQGIDSNDGETIPFRDYVFQNYNCDCCKCGRTEDIGEEPRMSIAEAVCFWFHEIWSLLLSTPCCVLDGFYMLLCLIAKATSTWLKDKLLSFVPKFKIMSPEYDLLEDYGYLHENFSYEDDLGDQMYPLNKGEREYTHIYAEAVKKAISEGTGKKIERKIREELVYVCSNNLIKKFLVLKDVLGIEKIARVRSKGMSLLHIALHNHCRDVAMELLKSGNNDLVLCRDTHRLTALHLAIVQNDIEIVEECLACITDSREKTKLLHTETSVKLLKTSGRGIALPLALAVWNANEDIFLKLIDAGAELDHVDRGGYSILHTVVFMSAQRPEEACRMYDLIMDRALQWWQTRVNPPCGKFPAMEVRYHLLNQRTKNDLLNPLALAAEEGSMKIMERILETECVYKFTVMKFGYRDIAYYDVTDLDPVLAQYKSTPSVVEQMIVSKKDTTLACLRIPIIEHLLDTKWNNYFWYYLAVFICYLAYMILLTMSIPSEPPKSVSNVSSPGSKYDLSPADMIDYLLDLNLTRLEWSIFGVSGLIWLFGVTSLLNYFMLLARRRFRCREIALVYKRVILSVFIVAYTTTIFFWIGLRLKNHPLQKVFLVVALVFGWGFLIGFLRGFKPTAFFSVMIERLLTKDVMLFGFCYICISLGFTSGFVVNMAFDPNERLDSYSDMKVAFFTLFCTMLGFVEPGELFDRKQFTLETYIINICLFVGFAIFTTILLLNMLIASMTNTYTDTASQSDLFYKRLRAFNVHLIEQSLPSVLQYFSSYYTIKSYKLKKPNGETMFRKVHLCRMD